MMKKKIVVSLPTRGEAQYLDRVVRSYLDNAIDLENVRVVVSIDDDDTIGNSSRSADLEDLSSVILSRAPRENCIGDKWNRAISVCPGDVYCVGADDSAILTKGWDEKLREGAALYPDDIGCIYFGEAPGAQLPMCQAVTKGWAEGFGGLYPSHFPYWFVDMWLDELAMMTGRMVWVDVQMMSCGGRGKTRGLRDVRFWNQFFDLTRPVREAQADKAIDELYKDVPWMAWRLRGKGREALRTVFDSRSQFIYQEAVEAEATRSLEAPEDSRYVNIKRNAELYLQNLYNRQSLAA